MILKAARRLSDGQVYETAMTVSGQTPEQQKIFERNAELAFARAEKQIQAKRAEQPHGASAAR